MSASEPAVAAAASGYKQPPSNILDVMRAPSLPAVVQSPSGDRFILVYYAKYPRIAHIATRFSALAGVRVDEANRNRRNTAAGHGIRTFAYKLDLVQVKDGKTVTVSLPPDARATSPIWSADGRYFAFENITADSVDLWIASGETGVARQVPDVRLNPVLDYELSWMPNQRHLLTKLVPKDQQPPPEKPTVPLGPVVQETDGKTGQGNTYEARDTLKNKYDEAKFDYYAASQLALVDAESLTTQTIGEVDIYLRASASPDGNYMFTIALRKDYSYNTGYARFPQAVKIWNLSDLASNEPIQLFELPLAEGVPIGGVSCGPREFSWRPNAPASLFWVEALDGGNWKNKVEHRDRVMLLEAPFNVNASRELLRTQHRFSALLWGEDPSFAILRELDFNTHWERRYIVNVDDPQQERKLILDMSFNERYNYPGCVILRKLSNGFYFVYKVGKCIFLSGAGSSKDGDRPFLDQFDTETEKTRRLFRSSSSAYEYFISFTDARASTFLTLHESPNDPPNVFQHTLGGEVNAPEGEAVYSTGSRAVTHIPNPTPLLSQIKKRVVTYQREDGMQLSFKLSTPPGYQEGTRVPTILYAYPRDFASGSEAGQVTGSQARFTRLHEYQFLLLAGYAILDAAFPIVGEPEKAYNKFQEQLVANAKAAVGKAVEIGVADPERVGVTGHSHGALMTATLLAHSDLFKAGVATSGGYNKTLTPFGFQSERRSLWEAPEPYRKASPFLSADKVKRPILLTHGADDANPGTAPMQSSTFYSAVRGNGGTAKLVQFPHEPHHYEARETHEHLIYEMQTWFDKYVKGSGEVKRGSKI